jgi:hypothetical protein
MVLVMRRPSGLRFDSRLPHFHLYGTDICLEAAKRGMTSYAIFAPCIHNTRQYLVLPNDFYECCEHIRRRWVKSLPIQTTCVRISRFNWAIRLRKSQELYLRYIRRKVIGGKRVQDIRTLVERFTEAARPLETDEPG